MSIISTGPGSPIKDERFQIHVEQVLLNPVGQVFARLEGRLGKAEARNVEAVCFKNAGYAST